MLTRTYITTVGGKVEALLLAPLCVVSEYRNRGLGSKLVNLSLEEAKKLGFKSVFVVGDPAYYNRFGFISSEVFGIMHIPKIPSENVMVLELATGTLKDIHGTVSLG